jgi:hypothetical protein
LLKLFVKSDLTKVVWDVTLAKKWSGRNPQDILEPLDALWAHIPNDRRKKLDAKSHACIMMGYFEESKAYRLFDLIKQEIIYQKICFL